MKILLSLIGSYQYKLKLLKFNEYVCLFCKTSKLGGWTKSNRVTYLILFRFTKQFFNIVPIPYNNIFIILFKFILIVEWIFSLDKAYNSERYYNKIQWFGFLSLFFIIVIVTTRLLRLNIFIVTTNEKNQILNKKYAHLFSIYIITA